MRKPGRTRFGAGLAGSGVVMNGPLTAVLFDVDGTLVDTNYLHVVCWWEAFGQAGFDVPMARIHRAIGMGSDQLLDALLPEDRDRDEDGSVRAAHSALYATYWSRQRPLRGAPDLLRACKKRGLRVVLASSADEREFAALRAALDADDAIDAATSSADVSQSKPARTWSRSRWRRRGSVPRRPCSWAIRSGTCRRAAKPGWRASRS